MTEILIYVGSILGGLFLLVWKAFSSGKNIGKNEIINKQNEEELQDIEDTRKRRDIRSTIPNADKRSWLRNYAKRNKEVSPLVETSSER